MFSKSLIYSIEWNFIRPGTWQIVGPNSSGYDDGCDTSGNFSVIVHGWLETSDTPWVSITVENLLKFRKGCVYVMDYSKMSNTPDFFALKYHFNGFAEVLKKKFLAIDNFDRQYCFGFSLGARICIEAGKKVGNQVIERMDLCDPVGELLGFFFREIGTSTYIFIKVLLLTCKKILDQQQKTWRAFTQALTRELSSTTVIKTSVWDTAGTGSLGQRSTQ